MEVIESTPKHVPVTERQYEVLILVAKGLKNEEIADILYITIHTVKAHLAALYEVFEVNSKIALVVKALKLKIINLEEI